jgi:hypothetical protein
MKGEPTPQMYHIRVQGSLDRAWSKWLGGMSIDVEQTMDGSPSTVLAGPIKDQAALRGVLNRLWDLNLDIISVNRIHGERQKR